MFLDSSSRAPWAERSSIDKTSSLTPHGGAVESFERVQMRFAEALGRLTEYQRQAFHVWRDCGFCDPEGFIVYEDEAGKYRVTDYFAENPSQLTELRQLAQALEGTKAGTRDTNDTPSANDLGEALRAWHQGYGRLHDGEKRGEHLNRLRGLFEAPFQMPMPGALPRSTPLSAGSDAAIEGFARPDEDTQILEIPIQAQASPKPPKPWYHRALSALFH